MTGGIHELTLLQAMWNHDKHLLLHMTALVLGEPYPPIVKVNDVAEIIGTEVLFRPLEEQTEAIRVTIRPDGANPKLKMDGTLRASVAFAEGIEGAAAIRGLHVAAVLTNALQAVTWIVGSLEAACKRA